MSNDFLFLFYVWLSGENCITKSQDFSLVCLKDRSERFAAYKQYIGECMGEWVEEIEKSYHRVLLGLLGKDSQRKLETMYPFRNLWKALRVFPATKMRFLKWLFLKLTTKWFENPVKESIVHFFSKGKKLELYLRRNKDFSKQDLPKHQDQRVCKNANLRALGSYENVQSNNDENPPTSKIIYLSS